MAKSDNTLLYVGIGALALLWLRGRNAPVAATQQAAGARYMIRDNAGNAVAILNPTTLPQIDPNEYGETPGLPIFGTSNVKPPPRWLGPPIRV